MPKSILPFFILWVVYVETLSCREEVVCGDKEDTGWNI